MNIDYTGFFFFTHLQSLWKDKIPEDKESPLNELAVLNPEATVSSGSV